MLHVTLSRSGQVATERRAECEQRVGNGFEAGGLGFYGVQALCTTARLIVYSLCFSFVIKNRLTWVSSTAYKEAARPKATQASPP
jgi:hypothetical protein